MKFGVRKPSIKRSVSARTTGKLKRTVNRTINPLYGKKGMGYINDPKKAVYNKVYSKTTVGVKDILNDKSGNNNTNVYIHSENNAVFEDESLTKLQSIEYTPNPKGAIKLIVFSILFALLGLCTMPIGILFIGIGVFLFFSGIGDFNTAKRNETNLPALVTTIYKDENGNEWVRQYYYTRIDIDLCNCSIDSLKANQNVELRAGEWENKKSVRCLLDNKIIGYINLAWQRDMIFEYVTREDYIIMSQISFIAKSKAFLRVAYYRSKQAIEREEAEIKAKYEAEKAAYVRKKPISFDATLVYNKSNEMQEDIQCINVGEPITLAQTEDERYLIVAKEVLYLGYLPKKIADRIDALFAEGFEVSKGSVMEKTTDAQYRYNVTVSIIMEDRNYL